MKVKTILLISLIILVISISFIQFNIMEEKEITKEKVFQGPVRPGDDEAHFRKTGITRQKDYQSIKEVFGDEYASVGASENAYGVSTYQSEQGKYTSISYIRSGGCIKILTSGYVEDSF